MPERPRARAFSVDLQGTPGPLNAITDVPGVEVGMVTLIEGEGRLRVGAGPVRTGVTAILPRGRGGVGVPCAAGWWSLNGNGEMTGTTWIEEVGELGTPILISNTHAVGPCHAGVIDWINRNHPAAARSWLLPVVGETWDGYLNDINGGHVTASTAYAALDAARPGPVPEGSVGGGTGMSCYGFKGGNGTSSRVVPFGERDYMVAAFVQANFGARRELVVDGRPVGRELLDDNPIEDTDWFERDGAAGALGEPGTPGAGGAPGAVPGGSGSVIVVVATDAPMLPGQCKALARRVPLGLARTGTTGSHFSGDIFLAFSTANEGSLGSATLSGEVTAADVHSMSFVAWARMNPFYEAVVQSVEEAVLGALVVNETMIGRDGHRSPALPHDRLRELLERGRTNRAYRV